jgi:hypothetical protein
MAYRGKILALDLAARTGWALGRPQETPVHGSVRFGKEGSSMAAVFSAARNWLDIFLRENPTIQLIVFEAPLLPMQMKWGKTNATAIRQLIGLAAVVEELLFTLTGYDVREARVSDVRTHFLGNNRAKRDEAKRLTGIGCKLRGWNPIDDNAADALALWDYQASLLDLRGR